MVQRVAPRALAICCAAVAIATFHALPAQERGPSIPAERKDALERIRRLESDPFGRQAGSDRRRVVRWLVEVPDIKVTVRGWLIDNAHTSIKNKEPQAHRSQPIHGMFHYAT